MAKYINPKIVKESFDRLGSKQGNGKSHLERTSAILYFLSFDAVCKHFDKSEIDLDPEKLEGKNNRKQLELEFTKLVLLENHNSKIKQISEFGKVYESELTPEKRISANFLTVPLKKATTQSEPYYYPKRPSAPLLKLGIIATKKKWGMAHHENCERNFFVVLSTARSSTPAFDICVLVFRDEGFNAQDTDLFNDLKNRIDKKFTPLVAKMLKNRIDKEKVLIKLNHVPYEDNYCAFTSEVDTSKKSTKNYIKMDKADLVEIILQLEKKIEKLERGEALS